MVNWENYCPVCREETQQVAENSNDDTGTHVSCTDCDNELPLPKVSIDEPFMIGDKVYLIHQGNDDEWRLIDYHDD